MRFQYRILFATLLCAWVQSAAGGSLADRAKDVSARSEAKKQKNKDTSNSQEQRDAAYSAFGSGTYPSSSGDRSFLSSFWGWLIAAPFEYRYDDPAAAMLPSEGRADDGGPGFPRHAAGQATVPYVRFDGHYQWADHVEAHDGRIEVGYKLGAFHGRMTRYEDEVGDVLDLRQYYGVLRYGGYRPDFLPGTFELAIGLGVVHHTGNAISAAGLDDDTSGAFTLPLKYHPFEWFGVEFRPAWYRWYDVTIGDYDLSASLGGRFVQLRGGYRWLWDKSVVDVQSGPYAGFSVSF
jgi:hypothetical protein